MRYKLFTHTDLDGVGCAVLAKIAFRDNVDIEYCDYDTVDSVIGAFICSDEISNYDKIFITDISVNDDWAEVIDKTCNERVVLLDHHPTALGLNKYHWCCVRINGSYSDRKTSGTELFYEYLLMKRGLDWDGAYEKFVCAIRDYDTWQWKSMGDDGIPCKQLNDLYGIFGRERFLDWAIKTVCGAVTVSDYSESAIKLILQLNQEKIDRYINGKEKQMFTKEIDGKRCGIVFAESNTSELGNVLCERHPEIDYVIIINMSCRSVSYRTVKDNIDLGKDVAAKYGGGGHPKAAGSHFPTDVWNEIVYDLFSC